MKKININYTHDTNLPFLEKLFETKTFVWLKDIMLKEEEKK